MRKNTIFAGMSRFKASVIISTYNQPKWLQKVLWSYTFQTEKNFEIIIADDGSTNETKELITNFKKESNLSISHVWQTDKGFRKTTILNKAIVKTQSNYLIFTDGDCLARKDFVEKHLALSKEGCFLSGGYFKLPRATSELIEKKHIENQICFDAKWLIKNGVKKTFKVNKLTAKGLKEKLLNQFTPTKATFDGMNVSGEKSAILEVNGFDERMQYGGEDREIGERLQNAGYQFIQARYSLICLHLFHQRPYKNEESLQKNQAIRKNTKKQKCVTTAYGIKSL